MVRVGKENLIGKVKIFNKHKSNKQVREYILTYLLCNKFSIKNTDLNLNFCKFTSFNHLLVKSSLLCA